MSSCRFLRQSSRQIIYLQNNRVRARAFYGVNKFDDVAIPASTVSSNPNCFLYALVLWQIRARLHTRLVHMLFLALLENSSQSLAQTGRIVQRTLCLGIGSDRMIVLAGDELDLQIRRKRDT